MPFSHSNCHFRTIQLISWGLVFLLLSACSRGVIKPTATDRPTAISASATATKTLVPTSTTDPALKTPLLPPANFTSELLREGISPVSYISDTCRFLELRWDPERSSPGTVVAAIMYHSIRPYGEEVSEPSWINRDYFDATIRLAKELGFETITSEELAAFLQENAKIPARSMLLILDDRRPGTAEEYFLPVLEENGWTATLAWLVHDTSQRTGLWEWIERLNESGYFDIQSHGLNHIYLSDYTPAQELRQEIFGSIPVLEEHFGKRPIAYIWPGGNYTPLGVEVAKEAGFQIGFTVHSRGPILFNWVPQGEQEQAIGEPLMLLPRFWSPAALLNLDQATQIGDAARAFAQANYAAEAAWYATQCGGQLPSLSDVFEE